MLIKAVFSGFGGQGVIMMGYLLATGGMYEGKNVTCLPSYGAEVRGGTQKRLLLRSLRNLSLPY
jgi:2-oxoglutarate ferredoxin oxidoreductase subunit gamma